MMTDMQHKIAALILFAMLGCSGADQQQAAPPIAAKPTPAVHDKRPVVLFLGTSLSAGLGVGADRAFPALIQQKIDSAGLKFRVENAGLSGETSAGGLRRLDWSLQQPIDVLVLELGANDGLRGLSVSELHANLDSIITRTHHRFPDADVVIAGMEAPPNLGRKYTTSFHEAFTSLARKHHAALIPFLLEGVGGKPELNQDDGIHPNVRGHQIVAETVWKTLKPILQKRVRARSAQAATG